MGTSSRAGSAIFVCTIGLILSLSASSRAHAFQVVIDPGHGGSDEGAIAYHPSHGSLLRVAEKNVTLTLALQVAQTLRARGIKVALTRTMDKDAGLAERTALANRIHADLFVSIHMNSTQGPHTQTAEGVETYILNATSDATSRKLARMENAVFSAYDTGKSDVSVILKDLRLEANLSGSKHAACLIQRQLVEATLPRELAALGNRGIATAGSNRGVKQALFHVLLGADMPSVLVEAGFISSPADRTRVLSGAGQMRMSQALARAIVDYRRTRGTRLASALVSTCQVRGQ